MFNTLRGVLPGIAALSGFVVLSATDARAVYFLPDDIVVTRTVYPGMEGVGTPPTVVGQYLSGGTPTGKTGTGPNSPTVTGSAAAGNTFPTVFQNESADGSFGITSQIFVDQLTKTGTLVNSLALNPNQITTSFPSKSELAINVSTDGHSLTLGGYATPAGSLDASNANTTGAVDPTNPDNRITARAIAQIDSKGNVQVTNTNVYSGNNIRAVIATPDG
jgi:hypothetical protein